MAAVVGWSTPSLIVYQMAYNRSERILKDLPDALDLLVVCVESGLGLDAGLRKVTDELKNSAKTICEEFTMANMQLQMGKSRRDVLHDLGCGRAWTTCGRWRRS